MPNQLPEPKSRANCKKILEEIETWKRGIYADLLGERLPLMEWLQLSRNLIAWRDTYAQYIEVAPLADFYEAVLQCARVASGVKTAWNPTDSELEMMGRKADGICNRLREFVEYKMPKKSGRPPKADAKQDTKIAEAWKTGHYSTHADLAPEFGLKLKDVKRAIDRARKRPQEQ